MARGNPNKKPATRIPSIVALGVDDKPLTEKERLFVNYVARDGMDYGAAARMAGYAGANQNGIMQRPHVARELAKKRKEFEISGDMSRQKVLEGFKEAIEMAKMAGEATPMIQGWTQIAKMCGYYEPTRHELRVTHQGEIVVQKLQTMSDDELLKLAEGVEVVDGEFKKLE